MALIRINSEAAQWLLRQVSYIATKNPQAAQRLNRKIRDARRLLAEQPGVAATGLIPGTRVWRVPPYVLTLGTSERGLQIIAIRHSRQEDALAPEDVQSPDPATEPEGSPFRP